MNSRSIVFSLRFDMINHNRYITCLLLALLDKVQTLAFQLRQDRLVDVGVQRQRHTESAQFSYS